MAKAEIRKPKPKQNPLKAADVTVIDYKDVALLRKFISAVSTRDSVKF